MSTPFPIRGPEAARARGAGPVQLGARILVVDDDPFICQMSVKTLVDSGYQVDTAEDGLAGWEALEAGNHDLLLTDHNMPRMSGLALVRRLRLMRMTLPVVLMSGVVPTQELAHYPWLKFAAILTKPFSPQELVASVRGALHPSGLAGGLAGASIGIPPTGGPSATPSSHWGLNE